MTELETRYYVLKFTYHIVYIKQIEECDYIPHIKKFTYHIVYIKLDMRL